MNDPSPTNEQLILYVLGELDRDDAALVAAHLASSGPAAEYVARVREVLETMRTDDSQAPTSAAVRSALAALVPQRGPVALAWLEQAKRIVARLVFDTRAEPALAGFRGGGTDYRLGYDSDEGRVDVRITPEAGTARGRWRVRGQVTTRQGAGVNSVALVTAGTTRAVTIALPDRHGQFRLEVPSGVYDLVAELATGALIAPDLDIG
jgi:anti-sigma factor RsiW